MIADDVDDKSGNVALNVTKFVTSSYFYFDLPIILNHLLTYYYYSRLKEFNQ